MLSDIVSVLLAAVAIAAMLYFHITGKFLGFFALQKEKNQFYFQIMPNPFSNSWVWHSRLVTEVDFLMDYEMQIQKFK